MGQNGCGKSGLLESLAFKLELPLVAVGSAVCGGGWNGTAVAVDERATEGDGLAGHPSDAVSGIDADIGAGC